MVIARSLLSPETVLTARHVLGNALTGDVRVQSHDGSGWTSKVHRLIDLGMDAALLLLSEPPADPIGSPPQLGAFGSSPRLVPAMVMGYPKSALITARWYQAHEPSSEDAYRRDIHLSGGDRHGDRIRRPHADFPY